MKRNFCHLWTYTVLLCSMLFAVSINAYAQQTTRGKDFYFSFLPNFHAAPELFQPENPDSLYIYIVADVATTGTIEFRNRAGVLSTRSFTITDPTRIYVMSLTWKQYELYGYNQREAFVDDNDNETPAKQVFHVSANNDVAVYALNKAVTTSDATLVLPSAALGTEYMVLSYNSDGSVDSRNKITSSYTPSQFAVIATQDNTDVTITPSVPTSESGNTVKRVRLQRGEAYLVQAQYSNQQLHYDLSGSTVSATKPVAVYTGHQRATVPIDLKEGSRDCLYKALLPLSVWGTRYVITPFTQPSGSVNSDGTDIYRVIAAQDSTVVQLNGKVIATLNKGKVFEAKLTQAGYLTANQKVLVALYKKTHTTGSSTGMSNKIGDPFMMIIPPRRQYLNKYRFTNVQVSGVYQEQYITVIAALSVTNEIKLDGRKLNVPFNTIPNSCFGYVNLAMTDGAHTLESPQPVGLYVYGYGVADSYGYVGGMAFIPDVEDGDVDAGPDLRTCAGKPVQLQVSRAAKSIRWSPSTGLSCDTCRTTTATITKPMTYIVSAMDSLGCQSSDTISISTNDSKSSFALGAAEQSNTMMIAIGSDFVLPVRGVSDSWTNLQAKSMDVSIRYNPSFMLSTDSLRAGADLPTDWTVTLDEKASNKEQGLLVLHASGPTAIERDGEFILPYFRSLLGARFDDKAELDVHIPNSNAECLSEESKGIQIQTGVCVGGLRQVVISPTAFTLSIAGANPVSSPIVHIDYGIGLACDAELFITDAMGKETRSLARGIHQIGTYSYAMNTEDVASGVYYLVLRAAGTTLTKPLLLTK